MHIRFTDDGMILLVLLYSTIYVLYQKHILQIKQITESVLCTLTRVKKLHEGLWLHLISILKISLSLSSSPQKECAAWLTTVKGFRFAPMNDPHHPPPRLSPLTVVPHAQRHLCGELLKKNGRVCPFLARLFL